jgi:hypothetical protein
MVLACDRCGRQSERKWTDTKAKKRDDHYCGHSCGAASTNHRGWDDDRRANAAARTSRRNAERWSDPENRRRQSEVIASTYSDPDANAARWASIKESWADPRPKILGSETRRTRGVISESQAERDFVAFLRSVLRPGDIVHHPPNVNGFEIDVFVPSAATFIQFDGVYWHGLLTPYDELPPHLKRRYDIDRNTDRWFLENGLRLIRMTDLCWKAKSADEKKAWVTDVVKFYPD